MSRARQSFGRWAALAAVAAVAVTGAASASQASPDPDAPVTVFDSVPSPLPGNYSSHAFLATSTTEAGDVVQLAPGNRTLDQVTVAMSSWACGTGGWSTGDCVTAPGATFTHDLTLTLYALDEGVPAAVPLTTITQSFAMPLRPAPDPVNCGVGTTRYQSAGGSCYNGVGFTVTFDATDVVELPDEVLVTVSNKTARDGLEPGPYDSLNLGAPSTTATVGSFVDADDFWLSSTVAGTYNTPGDTGVLRAVSGRTGIQPGFTITATPVAGDEPSPTASASASASASPSATASPTATTSPSATASPSGTSSPSATAGPSATPSPSTSTPPTDADLVASAQGGFTAPSSVPVGGTVPLTFTADRAGQTVVAFAFSTPTALGTHTVSAANTITVTLPSTLAAGQHRIAVYAVDGTLIGWQYIQVVPAGTALAATGADLTVPVGVGVLLLLAGAGLVLARRRLA